jgi:hypothetical protein
MTTATRTYKVVKRGKKVSAVLSGGRHTTQKHSQYGCDVRVGEFEFREATTYAPLGEDRIFAVDTESLTSGGVLKTLLTTVQWGPREGADPALPCDAEAIETPSGRGMLEALCGAVCERYGVPAGAPSRTVQRPRVRGTTRADGKPRQRTEGEHATTRDGRREAIPVCLSVWFNLAYDFGRLTADLPAVRRAVVVGADSYRVRVSPRYEIEVARMHFGSSASFEWFIRDAETGTIARMLGIDLTGYWKTSLDKAARAAGVTQKQAIPADWYRRPRESFTPEEWAVFREYGLGDVKSTLELYHATVAVLRDIDERVIRQSGVIPPSAPGAAARIVFARAFDCHPEMSKANGGPGTWPRPPQWADQLGCDSYYGGRVFSTKRGIHRRMISLDIKSAYPYALACLPDPVTAVYEPVTPRPFDVDAFRGLFGVLRIDGEGIDDVYPALRVHGTEMRAGKKRYGKLRYLTGKFTNHAATIPEIVLGVLAGTLRVDRIRSGCIMRGSADKSFLRAGILSFFEIKNNPHLPQAMRDMAKLLANATYGKLVEINAKDYTLVGRAVMPHFSKAVAGRVASTIARIYASNGPAIDPEDYFGDDVLKPAQVEKARAFYTSEIAKLSDASAKDWREGTDPDDADDRPVLAVLAYVEAVGGLPSKGLIFLKDFMADHSRFTCGQFFLPMCASLVTGLTSAIVGLAAKCLGALQGDTDSVHLVLPEGLTCKKDVLASTLGLPGWSEFETLLEASGYGQRIPGFPELGQWFCESPSPSVESVLSRPKVYSHHFAPERSAELDARADAKPGKPEAYKPSYKQAKHGFTRFFVPATEPPAVGPPARGPAELHAVMIQLLAEGVYTYTTRAAPRKLRESVIRGREVGEFVSYPVTLVRKDDENTWTDLAGVTHWLTRAGKRWRPRRKRDPSKAKPLDRSARSREYSGRV